MIYLDFIRTSITKLRIIFCVHKFYCMYFVVKLRFTVFLTVCVVFLYLILNYSQFFWVSPKTQLQTYFS